MTMAQKLQLDMQPAVNEEGKKTHTSVNKTTLAAKAPYAYMKWLCLYLEMWVLPLFAASSALLLQAVQQWRVLEDCNVSRRQCQLLL